MLPLYIFALLQFAFIFCASVGKKLNEHATLMSHDAATGYLTRTHVVAHWTITQGTDLTGQLNCGARSFDYRPYYDDGVLYAHHGGVKIHTSMNQSIDDIAAWSSQHPDEFVMLYVTACDGDDGCTEAAKELVKSKEIYMIDDCSVLSTLSYEEIYANSAMTQYNNGHVLALFGCIKEEYDSTVNCYNKDYTCYDAWPQDTSNVPWDHMKSYAWNTTNAAYVESFGYSPWMVQTHWQSTAGSITSGTLHKSSILQDEEKSKMNAWVLDAISTGQFDKINIVEVDNVCDGGNEIYEALQEYNKNY